MDKLADTKTFWLNCVLEKNSFYGISKVATMKYRHAYLFIHIVVCTVVIVHERFVRTEDVEAESAGSAVVVVEDTSEEVCLTS